MSGIPQTKKFNDKVYRYTVGYMTKAESASKLKALRKVGYAARAVKLTDKVGNTGYFIYTRTSKAIGTRSRKMY